MLATYSGISIEHKLSFCMHFYEVSKTFSNYLQYKHVDKKISFLFQLSVCCLICQCSCCLVLFNSVLRTTVHGYEE